MSSPDRQHDRQQDPEQILRRLTAYAATPEGVLDRLTHYAEQQPPLAPAPTPPEAPVFAEPPVFADPVVQYGVDLRQPVDDLLPTQAPRRRGFFGFRRRSRVRSGSQRRER